MDVGINIYNLCIISPHDAFELHMTTKVYNSFACDFSPYIISDALHIGNIVIVESIIITHASGESARLYTHSINSDGHISDHHCNTI